MTDLTVEEQANVRAALRFLRRRCGGTERLAKVLSFTPKSLGNVIQGETVSASMAFRLARLAGVAVDDVIAGRYPPAGACPHCGHVASEQVPAPTADR